MYSQYNKLLDVNEKDLQRVLQLSSNKSITYNEAAKLIREQRDQLVVYAQQLSLNVYTY